jgi:hypothetical protein
VLAAGFYVVALSGDIYNLTSPPALSWHVLLRKSYSIVAFAIVGAAFIWASGASLRTSALLVAIYSGAIEVGQHYVNAYKPIADQEPLYWSVIDVFCGAIGGALAGLIPWVRAR